MKNKKITLDDVKTFLEAAKIDLEDQQKEFATKYTDLIAAVDVAMDFLMHQPAKPKGEKIAVVQKNGEKAKAMWEKDLPDTDDKTFLFNPSLNLSEPKSLGEYAVRRNQYLVRLQDLDKALKLADKLQKTNVFVKHPIELLPIMRVLSRHDEYLDSLLKKRPSPKEKKSIYQQGEILDRLIEVVKRKESKKVKVKRFFTGIKNKLKKKKN
jgi:hypothetical protein